MMSDHRRRGLHLAAALVAAGLALSSAPPTAVAAGTDALSLTEAQSEELAQRLQPDVYGDLTEKADPQGAATGTDTGTGTDAATDADTGTGSSLDAGVKATVRGSVEGAQGMAATVPVTDQAGDYFTLHSLGNVSRRAADGSTVWERDNASFYKEWNLPPLSPRYPAEPYPARIVMGFNAVTPFSAASDHGYATGDLTGDGVPDVVFTADVGSYPFRPFVAQGYPLPTGTFVTVLDGRTGKTLWSKPYAGAYQVTVVDGTLILADSPTLNLNAPTTAKVTLTGIRFEHADGVLTPADTWTYDTGKTKANAASWASLKPLGGGLLAASWNLRKTSATAVPEGHTLVLDTTDGTVTWQSATDRLYSRQLHLDASRERLVALEQADPNEGVRYEIASYALADGTRTTLDVRTNAFPIALAVGDITGDERPEYAVSEDTLDPNLFVNANTVRALDGDSRTPLWSRTVKRDPANGRDGATAFGLAVAGDRIVASYLDDQGRETADNRGSGRYARIAALAGNNGAVKSEKRGVVASQAWVQPYRQGPDWRVRTVDTDQNIHVYNVGGGNELSVTPIRSELSSGVLTDVDGDGTQDVVAGGRSRGVYAYDGASMLAGTPRLLWQSTLPGQIHRIVKADTDGDGRDELVVAADTATAVLDSRTGKVLTTIDGGGRFVWTVTAGDTDGDGRAEIVVPTDAVRVYGGSGKARWSYAAPAEAGPVVFGEASLSEGRVHAEYASRTGFQAQGVPAGGVALDGATGAVRWTVDPRPAGATGPVMAIPLRGATFASPSIPYADGHAVVHTWLAKGGSFNGLVTFVEIRDGRTGELLHTGLAGGPWTLGTWFTGPEGLYLGSTAAVRLFGPDGADRTMSTVGQIENAGLATGPNGQRYVLGSGTNFFQLFDVASVTSPSGGFQSGAFTKNLAGNREMLTGDIDGDGKDELVSLGFDESGTDRTAALETGGYFVPHTDLRRLTVLTLDTP
ncbi:FG-GAP-like repeat-containing protein [Streptomyces sp. NRRL B-24572]|uniref:FG-GAP-like repeat-containing protein n=1 Tax=Streptomyces sp. NRRL B-24572 TaxID=1962156 RepID=UPI00211B3176|nr:FG-GAP-like repeat-containing protein [Streptomyces sp. NRRL B-24572]